MSNGFQNDKRNENEERVGGLLQSMNEFFYDKQVNGLLQHIDSFFSKTLTPHSFPVNLTENETEHVIHAELPGVNKNNIQLSILENRITIVAAQEDLSIKENNENQTTEKSRSFTKKTRTITLPYVINERKVTASFKNGLLIIHIPKEKGKSITID